MTRVILFLNAQQGGGKTTTVINLASAFKQQGANVLVVDLDAAGTIGQRVRPSNPGREQRAKSAGQGGAQIVSTAEGWHLMPPTTSIMMFHSRALYRVVRNTVFHDELRSLFEAYDYVLLDGSTNEETVLREGLALADEVIVPLDSESLQFYDALEPLRDLLGIQGALHPQLRFGGVFLAKYSPRFRRAREMLTALFDVLGPVNCFSAYLTESNEIREAERRRMSVLTDAPTSKAAGVFGELAEQIAATTPARLLGAPMADFAPSYGDGDGGEWTPLPEPDDIAIAGVTPNWLALAQSTPNLDQALRYAVLAMDCAPVPPAAVEAFESRLIERLEGATSTDVAALMALGEFVTEHGYDHYAAQLFRRMTAVDPTFLGGWAGLALTTHAEEERARALEVCLQLDVGLSAMEAAEAMYRARNLSRPSNMGTMVSSFSG